MKTVGISNIVSGLTGGFTGSYIFSQTIFLLRMGVNSPCMGAGLIVTELIILLLPFPILSYLLKAFFGALLLFIAIDMCVEWLYLSLATNKLAPWEHRICLFTFVATVLVGVQVGVLLGIGVHWMVTKGGYGGSGAGAGAGAGAGDKASALAALASTSFKDPHTANWSSESDVEV